MALSAPPYSPPSNAALLHHPTRSSADWCINTSRLVQLARARRGLQSCTCAPPNHGPWPCCEYATTMPCICAPYPRGFTGLIARERRSAPWAACALSNAHAPGPCARAEPAGQRRAGAHRALWDQRAMSARIARGVLGTSPAGVFVRAGWCYFRNPPFFWSLFGERN